MDVLKRKALIIFLLIVILACLIGYNGIYKYYLGKMTALKTQIETESKKNDILQVITGLNRRLVNYQKRSLATTEVTPLINTISALAKRANISLETFNPQPVKQNPEYLEIPLHTPIRCQYHQLGELLSTIESSQEFIIVKKLSMTKPITVQSKEARIPVIDLTLSGLYFKQ